MAYLIQAACLCNMGRVRRNNEDNFFFDGEYLPEINEGIRAPLLMEQSTSERVYLAVYDGMGGENYGETASFTAAKASAGQKTGMLDRFRSEEKYLENLAMRLNDAVVEQEKLLNTDRMGTTMAAVSFLGRSACVCNVGDSRVYLFRDGTLRQLSVDHVSSRPQRPGRKAPLIQHLGIDPEEMLIDPSVMQVSLQHGDCFLICSDGITDMLTDNEISSILGSCPDPSQCVQSLTEAALCNGGRDNITAIVCRVI